MAELLALAGAGGGGGGIGDIVGDLELAIGNVIKGLGRTVGRVGSAFLNGLKTIGSKLLIFARKVYPYFLRFMKYVAHEINLLLKASIIYMKNFYHDMQKDPYKSMEFIGVMAILSNIGL